MRTKEEIIADAERALNVSDRWSPEGYSVGEINQELLLEILLRLERAGTGN